MALGGLLQLCVSGSVYAEYEEVISRPRFKRSPAMISGALQAIREKGLWVRPIEKLRISIPMTISFWNAPRLRMPITLSPEISSISRQRGNRRAL
jgi:hypothetical protein